MIPFFFFGLVISNMFREYCWNLLSELMNFEAFASKDVGLSTPSSGAYVMVENYLYTMEAISDYWDHLSENGIIQISRWHYPNAPREELRAFIMAYKALSQKGVPDPSRHLLVIGDRVGEGPLQIF